MRFFARIDARVGLSIDGPADLHDANRRTRHGQGTHDKAMRAVRLLQDQGLPFHVITVLTERAVDYPERLFDFYVQNGIKEKNAGFNIEEIEGANTPLLTRTQRRRGKSQSVHEALLRAGLGHARTAQGARVRERAWVPACGRAGAGREEPLLFAIVSIGHGHEARSLPFRRSF